MSDKGVQRLRMVEIYSGKDPEWKGWHNLLVVFGEEPGEDEPIAGPIRPEISSVILEAIKPMSSQDKIKAAIEVCGADKVWDSLNEFCDGQYVPGGADRFVVHDDGSIHDEDDGNYLTDGELDDFVDWAKEENK